MSPISPQAVPISASNRFLECPSRTKSPRNAFPAKTAWTWLTRFQLAERQDVKPPSGGKDCLQTTHIGGPFLVFKNVKKGAVQNRLGLKAAFLQPEGIAQKEFWRLGQTRFFRFLPRHPQGFGYKIHPQHPVTPARQLDGVVTRTAA